MKFIREPDKSIDQTQKRMSEMLEYSKSNLDYGIFLAFEKESGVLIGWALFLHSELNLSKDIEVGYRLFPQFWGKGYASELTERFVDVGLNKLELSKLIAVTDPRHDKSKNVLLKNKFKYIDEREYYGHICSYFEVKND
jgi:RimJ/RimL family protein N-acetyltransferase